MQKIPVSFYRLTFFNPQQMSTKHIEVHLLLVCRFLSMIILLTMTRSVVVVIDIVIVDDMDYYCYLSVICCYR